MICICTTPRSGSETFCKALRDGGLRHVYEVAHPFYRAELAKLYGDDLIDAPVADVIARLRAEESVGHQIAVKLFYPEMQAVAQAQSVNDMVFIHLDRRDLAAQAVSLLAMWATGRAMDSTLNSFPFETSLPDDRNAKIAIAYLRSGKRSWAKFLTGRDAHHVVSEDMLDAPQGTFSELGRFLAQHGVELEVDAAAQFISQSKRYAQDADLKAQLRKRFAPLLNSLSR